MEENKIYLSLGDNCHAAWLLKYFNLRKSSNLFDWAACERFEILTNILLHNIDSTTNL
jgi:hypothetical protein